MLLRGAMEKLPTSATVLLALDDDAGGEKLVREVEAVAPVGRELQRMVPDAGSGKDWNEVLKDKLGLV